ncbi:MAG: siderophore-interacting protein [Dehalococcoidia bacterium]|nr:siderophore-interacting protein [Dehalococcoidia bacterium]
MEDYTQIRTFLTSVRAVRQVTPLVRRITFAGGDLGAFRCIAPDQFVYLLLPPPGRTALTVDQGFTWAQYRQMPEPERPVGAYYTVREHRAGAGELDIDVVLHEPSGHASGWAGRAQPGDPVALWGPRTAYAPPADTEWHLLVGDETALPAIAAILRALPLGMRATAVIEVANAQEEQPLPTPAEADVRWLHRNDAEAGHINLVVEALEDLALPSGVGYAWGGGEVKMMNLARRLLRQRGLDRASTSLVGYWRHPQHADLPDERDI